VTTPTWAAALHEAICAIPNPLSWPMPPARWPPRAAGCRNATKACLTDNGWPAILVTQATLAFDADHRLTGYKLDTWRIWALYNSQFGQRHSDRICSSPKLLNRQPMRSSTPLYAHPRHLYEHDARWDAYSRRGAAEAILVLGTVHGTRLRANWASAAGICASANFIAAGPVFPIRRASGVNL